MTRTSIVSQVASLQPIILTRDAVQKHVLGAGYPSLPTMTVSEWYDKMNGEGHFDAPYVCLVYFSAVV